MAEVEICRPDGERRFIEQVVFTIHTEAGHRLATLTTDITARKRSEAALTRSEARYRSLFTDTIEAMSIVRDARIADANRAWLMLHGYADRRRWWPGHSRVHPPRGPGTDAAAAGDGDRRRPGRTFFIRDLRVDGP